jgi:hypothetical protein
LRLELKPYFIGKEFPNNITSMEFVSSVQEVESELIENGILNYHKPISHKYEIKTTTPNAL